MYLLNKYTKWYNAIIASALARKDIDLYFEKHHILPKCLGGSDDKTNLVKLTLKEHFICHLLLIRMVDDKVKKAKLTYACWQMTKRYSVTSREYESLKLQLSTSMSGIPKSEEHKASMRKPKSNTTNMKGGPGGVKGSKREGQALENIRNAVKLQNRSGEHNPFYGKHHTEETKQYYRELFTGQKISDEHKLKISQGLKGKPTWNKGVPMNDLSKIKASQSLSGRITINNGVINKRVKKELLEEFLTLGWIIGQISKIK